jgi:hypothetical protein
LFDPNEPNLDLDMTEGLRPASSAGDRLVVGLAIIALLGGALIGISRLFPSRDGETSVASGTPHQTVEATPTVQPTPSPPALVDPLRTFRISEEPLPAIDGSPVPWGGWARATERIKVRSAPSTTVAAIAVLQPGDAAWVQEESPTTREAIGGWMRTEAPVAGWIRARTGPDGNLRLFGNQPADGASVSSVTAGADGRFVVAGTRWRDGAYFVGTGDGSGGWQMVDTQRMVDDISSFQAAYGPSGWLALVTISTQGAPQPWLWQSGDGNTWRTLGALRELPNASPGPLRLAGSPLGYAMTPFYQGNRPLPKRVWYSADGEVWSERETPIAPSQVVAAGLGFYASAVGQTGLPTSDAGQAAFSANGWDWSAVDTSDMAVQIGIAGAEDRLVALDHVGHIIHTWIARLENGQLVWRRELTSEGEFANAVVTEMSGGVAPIAVGYERGSETALWWSNDEAGWHRHVLARPFGGIASMGAAGDRGYVVVGTHHAALGDTPVLWSAEGSTQLRPERQALIAPRPDLGPDACASYSRDLLEFMSTFGLIQAHCYGDAPVTLTAYVPRCPECTTDPPAQTSTYRPGWLNQTGGERVIRLSPVAVEDLGWFEALLGQDLQPRSGWEQHWVRVIGHFDDPAAATCRVQPGPDDERWYTGRQQVINDCRSRFVVTSVTVLRPG